MVTITTPHYYHPAADDDGDDGDDGVMMRMMRMMQKDESFSC